MQQTTNYKFNKIQLSDSPADITVLNTNWDIIDTQLKKLTDEKFNKTGGEVSGKVTITKNGLKVTGGSETDTINVTENGEVGGTLTVSGKVTANGGLDVAGGIVNGGEYKLKVDITKGQTPSEAKFATIGIYDNSLKEGYRLGRVQYGISINNTASIAMYVNRPNDAESEDPSGILVQWLNGTTARISVTHHPETASNDKTIATTYWVRNLKATASQYGLTKLADETALLTESGEATLTVDKAYQLNDFRRMSTAYVVGDKVNCAFNFGFFLECTQAGTTSAESLDTRNVTFGQVITDGTAQWTVRAHVKSINGVVPDANGDVEIDVDMTEYALEQDILDACDEALESDTGGESGQTDLETLLNQYQQMVVNYQNILSELNDYVIEKGENANGWYRIYKSGWVEQGGSVITTERAKVVELPIEMQDTNYKVQITVFDDADYGGISGSDCLQTNGSTTTQITVSHLTITTGFTWEVKGYRKTTTAAS